MDEEQDIPELDNSSLFNPSNQGLNMDVNQPDLTPNFPDLLSPESPWDNGPYKNIAISNTEAGNLNNPPRQVVDDPVARFNNNISNAISNSTDDNIAGAVGTYNADYDGYNFERYSSHTDSGLFQKLGFSPFRDNETLYNNHSSGWKDWQRGNNQFWNVFGVGFKNYFTSYGDIFSGDITGSDLEGARGMERAMAIGSSSREGIASWANNTVINSGMTFGMIGAFMAEEAALVFGAALAGIGTAPAGGAGATPFLAKMAHGAFRFKQGIQASARMSSIGKFGRVGGGLISDMKKINELGAARVAWNTVKNTGKIINPLEGSIGTGRLLAAKSAANKVKSTENAVDFIDGYTMFGAMVRDVRNVNMALAESKLEAGLVELEVSKKRYEELDKQEGPISEEQVKSITHDSKKAGYETLLWNFPLIYGTNQIVFDGIMQPFRRFKSKLPGGQIADVSKVAKGGSATIENFTAKPWLKRFYKPKNIARNIGKYTSRNWAEGVQELYQEGIAAGLTDYYVKDELERGGYYNTMIQGMNTMKSMEGFGVFMSGFTMGGLVGFTGGAKSAALDVYARTGSRAAKYKANQKKEEDVREANIKMLNEVFSSPLKYANDLQDNVVNQTRIEQAKIDAIKSGDVKAYRDLVNTQQYTHVSSVLKLGLYDGFVDRIKQFQELDDQSLQEAFSSSMTLEELENTDLRAKLQSVLDNAENIKKRKTIADQEVNPFNPNAFKPDTIEREQAEENYISFEDAKDKLVFMQYSFDKTLERMTNIANTISSNKPLSKVSSTDFTILLNEISMNQELDILNSDIFSREQNESMTKSQKKQLKNLKDKREKLETFNTKLSELKEEFKKKKKDKPADETEIQYEGTLNGKKQKIKGTIIEELDDGKVKVKRSDGKTVTVSKNNISYLSVQNAKNTERVVNDLFDLYEDYLKVLARSNGEYITSDKIRESFELILDHHELESDALNLENAVNILLNPGGFEKFRQNAFKEFQRNFSNKEEDLRYAYDKYRNLLNGNIFANKLWDAGYWIQPIWLPVITKGNSGMNQKIPFYYKFDDKENAGQEVTDEKDLAEIQKVVDEFLKESKLPSINVTTDVVVEEEEGEEKGKGKEDEKELSVDTAIEDLPKELFEKLQNRFLKFAETNNIDIDNLEGGEFQNWYKDKKNKKIITGIINTFKNKKGDPKIKTKKKKLTEIEKLEEAIKNAYKQLEELLDDYESSSPIIQAQNAKIEGLENKLAQLSSESQPTDLTITLNDEIINELDPDARSGYFFKGVNNKIKNLDEVKDKGQTFIDAKNSLKLKYFGYISFDEVLGRENKLNTLRGILKNYPTKADKVNTEKYEYQEGTDLLTVYMPQTLKNYFEGQGKMNVYSFERMKTTPDIDEHERQSIISNYINEIKDRLKKAGSNADQEFERWTNEFTSNNDKIGKGKDEIKLYNDEINDIDEILNEYLNEVLSNVPIEDIEVGQVFKYKRKKYYIMNKTNDEILYKSVNIADLEEYEFTEEIMKDKSFKLINDTAPIEDDDVNPTDGEAGAANENQNNIEISNDQIKKGFDDAIDPLAAMKNSSNKTKNNC